MRLVSWNVFNENPDAGRIRDFLDALNPDLLLLQEALPDHLAEVRERYPHIATARDYILKGESCHLAIASRSPLERVATVRHFPDDKPHPSRFSRWAGWVEFLDTLAVDVVSPEGGRFRCVVVHTSAAVSPTIRVAEVDAAVEAHVDAQGPCLVAGDFNCFSTPWIAPLLALPFGYGFADLGINERKALETRWRCLGFAPQVRGVTVPRWRLQADQVFTRDLRVATARIEPKLWGSDHRPLVLEIEDVEIESDPSATSSRRASSRAR